MRMASRLAAFGGVIAVGLAALIATGEIARSELKVSGPVYGQIVLGKDLIADVLPPPAYVIEAYLEATLAKKDPSTLRDRAARVERLQADFETRTAFWRGAPIDEETRRMLTAESVGHVDRFFAAVQDKLVPALAAGDAAAADRAYAEVSDAYAAHRAVVDRIVARTVEANTATEADAAAKDGLFSTIVWSAAGLVLLAIAGGLWLFWRSGIAPLAAMTAATSRLAAGDLDAPIPKAKAGDEIGDLAAALAVFRANAAEAAESRARQEEARRRSEAEKQAALSGMADHVETATVRSMAAAGQLAAELKRDAEAVKAAVGRADDQAAQVATAAGDALANANAVSAATTEMSASIGEIAGQAGEASRIAAGAVQAGQEARGQIEALAGAVSQIGEFADVISAIASQTNLLALNATIEAARAGEAGRGFAVVAGEVKALSSQTAKSTEDIRRQVEAIQNVMRGAEAAVRAIGARVGEVDQVAAAIAAAVEEQSAATNEIARNVEESARSVRSVAEAIAAVTSQTRETAGRADAVLGRAERVASEMSTLKTDIVRAIRSSTEDADRRRADRFAVNAPCRLAGAASGDAIALDLSQDGAMLRWSGSAIAAGATVSLAFGPAVRAARVIDMIDDRVHLGFTEPPSAAFEAAFRRLAEQTRTARAA